MTMKYNSIEFIAQLLNEQSSKKDGYSMPVRWGCLRSDLQEKYLQQAQKLVNDWAKEEIEAEQWRNKFDSMINLNP